jgi:hypothetical protein
MIPTTIQRVDGSIEPHGGLYDCSDLPRVFERGLVTAIAAWPGSEREMYEIARCP